MNLFEGQLLVFTYKPLLASFDQNSVRVQASAVVFGLSLGRRLGGQQKNRRELAGRQFVQRLFVPCRERMCCLR